MRRSYLWKRAPSTTECMLSVAETARRCYAVPVTRDGELVIEALVL